MMLNEAALPPLQSLADGPSTVFWVAELQKEQQSQWHLAYLDKKGKK